MLVLNGTPERWGFQEWRANVKRWVCFPTQKSWCGDQVLVPPSLWTSKVLTIPQWSRMFVTHESCGVIQLASSSVERIVHESNGPVWPQMIKWDPGFGVSRLFMKVSITNISNHTAVHRIQRMNLTLVEHPAPIRFYLTIEYDQHVSTNIQTPPLHTQTASLELSGSYVAYLIFGMRWWGCCQWTHPKHDTQAYNPAIMGGPVVGRHGSPCTWH